MAIQIRVNGIDAAQGQLRSLPEAIEASVIRQMAQIAYDSAERGADAHTKTGAMRQSLFARAIPKGREVGHDLQRAPHALFVQFGTRPHVITPSKKKALRWPAGGAFAFAKRVNHPGYRGDAYLARAADDAVRQFAAIVDRALKEPA